MTRVPQFDSLEDVQRYLDRLQGPSVEYQEITAFQNSWQNYGTPWQKASYTVDENGFVKVAGLVSTGIAGTMFVLPPAVSPPNYHMFPVLTDTGIGRLDVYPSGAVVMNGGAGNGYVSLGTVSFYRI